MWGFLIVKGILCSWLFIRQSLLISYKSKLINTAYIYDLLFFYLGICHSKLSLMRWRSKNQLICRELWVKFLMVRWFIMFQLSLKYQIREFQIFLWLLFLLILASSILKCTFKIPWFVFLTLLMWSYTFKLFWNLSLEINLRQLHRLFVSSSRLTLHLSNL